MQSTVPELNDMSHASAEVDVLAFAFEARSFVADLNAALAEVFRPIGLTCVQAEALLALGHLGPTTLKELGEHLVAESGHPSRLISRLVADGLVAREVSARDARAVTLTLTDRGQACAEAAREARAPLIDEVACAYAGRLAAGARLMSELRRHLARPGAAPARESVPSEALQL